MMISNVRAGKLANGWVVPLAFRADAISDGVGENAGRSKAAAKDIASMALKNRRAKNFPYERILFIESTCAGTCSESPVDT